MDFIFLIHNYKLNVKEGKNILFSLAGKETILSAYHYDIALQGAKKGGKVDILPDLHDTV